MFQDLRPDIIIMDLYLPDGSGLTAAERILAEAPETRIVMLTGNPSQEALREAARMGICGFLPKDGALGVMLDTLRHVRAGNMIVNPSLVATLGQHHRRLCQNPQETDRRPRRARTPRGGSHIRRQR